MSPDCTAPPARTLISAAVPMLETEPKTRSAQIQCVTGCITPYSTPPETNAALPAGVASWRSTTLAASAAVAPVISAAS